MKKKSDIVIISEGQPIIRQKAAEAPPNPQSNPEKFERIYQVVGDSGGAGVYIDKAELAAWREKNRRESTSGSN